MDTSKMVFVFGSNLGGIHGAGAARHAMRERGAKYGVAFGPTGSCFAIPTKDAEKGRVTDTLPLEFIRECVDRFVHYAQQNPQLTFQVTRIGCGLAGLRDEDVALMFSLAPGNCWFDSIWQQIFDEQFYGRKFNYWGTF